MRVLAPWRLLLSILSLAMLLATGVAAPACQVRCDLMRNGAAAHASAMAMGGMDAGQAPSRDATRAAPLLGRARAAHSCCAGSGQPQLGVACAQAGCVEQPALLTSRDLRLLPPQKLVVPWEYAASRGDAASRFAGSTRMSRWRFSQAVRAPVTPVAWRTTLRL